MFNEYFQLGTRLRAHYLSPRVFLCLVTGRFVPPIHRKNLYSLQYSMLPAQRAGIGELWSKLMEKDASPSARPKPMPVFMGWKENGAFGGMNGRRVNGGVHGRR